MQVERELDLEISGSWERFEQVLEWNRFVVGSCRVVKRKAEDSRGSAQQVERAKPDRQFVGKTEESFPQPAALSCFPVTRNNN